MRSRSQKRLITVKQAATMLGVAPNTIRAWGAAGKIPEYRHPINNYRLYKPVDIENVLRLVEEPTAAREPGSKR